MVSSILRMETRMKNSEILWVLMALSLIGCGYLFRNSNVMVIAAETTPQDTLSVQQTATIDTSLRNQPWQEQLKSYLYVWDWDENRRYKVLSFFFDGVPNPASAKEDNIQKADTSAVDSTKTPTLAVVPKKRPSAPTIYTHQPYRERKCEKCHRSDFGQKLKDRADLICNTCHEQFKNPPAFVHGPVAVGQCTTCHSPHTSKYPKLLIREGNKICTFCHEAIDRVNVAEHQSVDNPPCTSCHSPHFSDGSRFYLLTSNRSP